MAGDNPPQKPVVPSPLVPAAASAPPKAPKAFNCPSCGGLLQIRVESETVVVGCGSCGSVIDVDNDNYKIISAVKNKKYTTIGKSPSLMRIFVMHLFQKTIQFNNVIMLKIITAVFMLIFLLDNNI